VDNSSRSIYAKELVRQSKSPKGLAKEAANTIDQIELLFGESTDPLIVVTDNRHGNDQFELTVAFSHVDTLTREP
jgi:hypothetical protein